MSDKPMDKYDAESELRSLGLTDGDCEYSGATGNDIYEMKVLLMGLLQQGQKTQEQNGELLAAFNRVADTLERLEKHLDPTVKKGKPMKLDELGK